MAQGGLEKYNSCMCGITKFVVVFGGLIQQVFEVVHLEITSVSITICCSELLELRLGDFELPLITKDFSLFVN